jgi:hypothetical protein
MDLSTRLKSIGGLSPTSRHSASLAGDRQDIFTGRLERLEAKKVRAVLANGASLSWLVLFAIEWESGRPMGVLDLRAHRLN